MWKTVWTPTCVCFILLVGQIITRYQCLWLTSAYYSVINLNSHSSVTTPKLVKMFSGVSLHRRAGSTRSYVTLQRKKVLISVSRYVLKERRKRRARPCPSTWRARRSTKKWELKSWRRVRAERRRWVTHRSEICFSPAGGAALYSKIVLFSYLCMYLFIFNQT